MKKSLSLLLAILMLMSVIPMAASAVFDEDNEYYFTYEKGETTASLYYTRERSTKWILPDIVSSGGQDLTVTEIYISFFKNSTTPQYVDYIKLPSTLVKIQDELFKEDCFTNLYTIEISGAETICNDVFMGCKALNRFVVNEANPTLKAIDGVLFNDGGAKLQRFPAAKRPAGTTVYEVPDGTESIGGYAFYKAKNITDVKIPASVTEVGNGAFCCDNIKGIHFEDGSAYDFSRYTCYCSNYGFSSTCAEKFCLEDIESAEASCSVDGHTEGIRCDITGEWLSGEVIPATENHSFTELVEERSATCTEDAIEVYKCISCEKTKTQTIGASLGHKGGVATCNAQAVCTVCSNPYGELDVDAHSFDSYKISEEASCGKSAKETAVCANGCGKTNVREIEGSALEHSFTKYETILGTSCDEDKQEKALCDNGCGSYDVRTIKGSAIGHKAGEPIMTVQVAPTCEKAGSYVETVKCLNCGDVLTSEMKNAPALGHADDNHDGNCDRDNCNYDFTRNCGHLCHKGGFWYKLCLFFWRLFKTNKECSCGMYHY